MKPQSKAASLQPVPSVTAEVVVVTPDLAREWVAGVRDQRKVDWETVRIYAAEMQRGAWELTGSAIQFGASGDVIDGQHRLHAVVRANVSVPFLVCRGVADTAFDVIDQGKGRSYVQLLQLAGYKNSANLGSVHSLLVREVAPWEIKSGSYRGSRRQLRERMEQEHPGLADFINRNLDVICDAGAVLHAPSVVGYTLYRLVTADHIHETRAVEFFRRFADGTGLAKTSPIWVMREAVLRGFFEKYPLSHQSDKAFVRIVGCRKTFHQWHLGRALKIFRVAPSELSPELRSRLVGVRDEDEG